MKKQIVLTYLSLIAAVIAPMLPKTALAEGWRPCTSAVAIQQLLISRDINKIACDVRSFNGATLTGDFEGVSFSGARLQDVTFKSAKLSNADFEGSILVNVTISGSDFAGASFHHAYFEGSTITESTGDKADFSDADVAGVVLEGSTVTLSTTSTQAAQQM